MIIHVDQWYIHKPESVPENRTHKTFYDFEMGMDHQIQASIPEKKKKKKNNQTIYKKKRTCNQVEFAVHSESSFRRNQETWGGLDSRK